jgi:His-Xaa-Ser system protein HxsD
MAAPQLSVTLGANSIALRIEESIYPRAAIARAAFRFSDRASCLLACDDELPGVIWATFFAKDDSLNLPAMAREFADELLDQQLRLQLETEFNDLRLLITAQAFSEGNLLNPDDDTTDFRLDPRNIGRAR